VTEQLSIWGNLIKWTSRSAIAQLERFINKQNSSEYFIVRNFIH